MLEPLWGLKENAIFDVWTIEHFLSGVSIGTAVMIHQKKNLGKIFEKVIGKFFHAKKIKWMNIRYEIYILLMLAFVWETIEHYLETGLLGETIKYWFYGVEFWPNRLISDPLMLILGYMVAKKFPTMVWPARILSIVWIIFHVFVFPHSMYLHEFF
jgi:hypothetical protein